MGLDSSIIGMNESRHKGRGVSLGHLLCFQSNKIKFHGILYIFRITVD